MLYLRLKRTHRHRGLAVRTYRISSSPLGTLVARHRPRLVTTALHQRARWTRKMPEWLATPGLPSWTRHRRRTCPGAFWSAEVISTPTRRCREPVGPTVTASSMRPSPWRTALHGALPQLKRRRVLADHARQGQVFNYASGEAAEDQKNQDGPATARVLSPTGGPASSP